MTDTSAPSWKSFPPSRPLADPSRASSNPLESLRGLIFYPLDRYFSPFVEIVSPFPTFGGSLLSLLQPLRVPSRTPCPTFGGSLSSLLQRLRGPSPFFVALRGYLFAFSWKSFLPLATSGGSLLSLLQPLRGPSCPFVDPLRGYLFSLLVGLRHGLASAQQLTQMSSPSILIG